MPHDAAFTGFRRGVRPGGRFECLTDARARLSDGAELVVAGDFFGDVAALVFFEDDARAHLIKQARRLKQAADECFERRLAAGLKNLVLSTPY